MTLSNVFDNNGDFTASGTPHRIWESHLGMFFMMMIICKQFIISFFEEYTKFKKLNNKIFKKLKEVETKKDEAWLLIKFYFCINLGHCILSLGLHLVLHSSSQGMFLLHYACHVAFCMSLCIIIYICSCILPFVGFFFLLFFLIIIKNVWRPILSVWFPLVCFMVCKLLWMHYVGVMQDE